MYLLVVVNLSLFVLKYNNYCSVFWVKVGGEIFCWEFVLIYNIV